MTSRFSDREPMDLALVLPPSVNDPKWTEREQDWLTACEAAANKYNSDLPKPTLLLTELMVWRNHW